MAKFRGRATPKIPEGGKDYFLYQWVVMHRPSKLIYKYFEWLGVYATEDQWRYTRDKKWALKDARNLTEPTLEALKAEAAEFGFPWPRDQATTKIPDGCKDYFHYQWVVMHRPIKRIFKYFEWLGVKATKDQWRYTRDIKWGLKDAHNLPELTPEEVKAEAARFRYSEETGFDRLCLDSTVSSNGASERAPSPEASKRTTLYHLSADRKPNSSESAIMQTNTVVPGEYFHHPFRSHIMPSLATKQSLSGDTSDKGICFPD